MRRPVWEDPLNRAGGKWIIRLRKGVAERVWEDLVCGVVGDMFDECGKGRLKVDGDGNLNEDDEGEEWPEICGCTISVRQSEDIVSVWNRVEADIKVREKIRWVACLSHMGAPSLMTIHWIRDTIRSVLNLPASTIMEYKSNNGTCSPTCQYSYLVDLACLMQTRYRTSPHFVTLPLNVRLLFPNWLPHRGWGVI